ncbi:hypothetical protein SAMN05444279_12622 [Ruegeria intermedia]|uniref:Uncharacterized protein n=2 Tax=Ruegeria intermedia TaxID=996115 RepID=A0A1M5AJU1_9RHOB|nr:hypothetical protein SAMN05444279_12622 [Ruegeria intermedia]
MHLAIHSGADFTDGGLLFHALRANSDLLSDAGVLLYGPKRCRRLFMSPLKNLANGQVEPETVDRLRSLMLDGNKHQRAVLTSPGFIGETPTALRDGQFYPMAGQRLAFFEQTFAQAEMELFVGVRNPGSFIPKALMALPPEDRAETLANTDISCLSWLTMIEDIRDLAPNVAITLWANEDLPVIFGDIVRAICGLPGETPIENEFALLSSLLDDDGRDRLEELIRPGNSGDRPALLADLSGLFEDHALPHEVEEELDMPGWSTDIVEAFTELYAQDLARLKSMPGIRVLGL